MGRAPRSQQFQRRNLIMKKVLTVFLIGFVFVSTFASAQSSAYVTPYGVGVYSPAVVYPVAAPAFHAPSVSCGNSFNQDINANNIAAENTFIQNTPNSNTFSHSTYNQNSFSSSTSVQNACTIR